LRKLQGEFAGPDPVRAAVLHTVGQLFARAGSLLEARTAFETGVTLLEGSVAPDEPLLGLCLTSLAATFLYGEPVEPERAEPLLRRALGIMSARFGSESLELAVVLEHMAQACLARRQGSEARPLLRRALAILGEEETARSRRAALLNSIGATYLFDGDLAQATGAFEEALRALPEGSAASRAVGANLVKVYEEQGRAEEAQALRSRLSL
jgi:tetratricopeptide (TPR) repeat protein